jgi:ribosomal protein L31E
MTKLPYSLITKDQQNAISALYQKNTLLVCPMGGGKSIMAATAISELVDDGHIKRVLIVTTPKIANTVWAKEFAKWEHTAHIRVVAATADAQERLDLIRDQRNTVVVVTFNVLPWIKDEKLFGLFDGLLIDETTKLKTPGGEQFKAIRKALNGFTWRCGLTGTPVSESFEALYAQMMLIDAGQALGTRFDSYMNTYFDPQDFKRYNWKLKPGSAQAIMRKIAHMVHTVPDYTASLPPINYVEHEITMPAQVQQAYDAMESDGVFDDVTAANAAVAVNKLIQIASGFAYDDTGAEVRLSDYRVRACADLILSLNENAIVVYWFEADKAALQSAIPNCISVTPANLKDAVAQWNAGSIPVLLVHPRSCGHGLQLEQGGRHVVWLGPQWSRDLWLQTNARVWRRGQTKPVYIHTFVAQNTIDCVVVDRVMDKGSFQDLFNQYLQQKKGKAWQSI